MSCKRFAGSALSSLRSIILKKPRGSAFTLIVLLIACTYMYFQSNHNRAADFRIQVLRINEAANLATEIEQSIRELGRPSLSAFQEPAKRFSDRFPECNLYILNPTGEIVLNLSPMSNPKEKSVRLSPIEEFLDSRGMFEKAPIYGDDPERPGRPRPFLVAPLNVAGLNGYVYIVWYNRMRRLLDMPMLERGHYFGTILLGAYLLVAIVSLAFLLKHILLRMMGKVTGVVTSLAPDIVDSIEAVDEVGLDTLEHRLTTLVERIAADRANLQTREAQSFRMISQVSHDFRTPLFLILEYADRLLPEEDGSQAPEVKREVDSIKRNVKSLVGLLSEFHLFNELKGKTNVVRAQDCDIIELVADLTQMYSIEAEKRSIVLRWSSNADQVTAVTDPMLLERALRNLVENALRHTNESGSVELRVSLIGKTAKIEVRDTGCGIPAAELDNIFKPFHQVNGKQRKNGSSGLGLAIVDQVLSALGSKINVESVEAMGTTFWFELAAHGQSSDEAMQQ